MKKAFAEIAKHYVDIPDNSYTDEDIERILCLEQDRVKTMNEIGSAISFAFNLPDYEADLLCFKDNTRENTKKMLECIVSGLEDLQGEWNSENLQNKFSEMAEEEENKGSIFHPVRVAVSGQKSSPPPQDIMYAIGKKESIARIKIAINKL